MKRLLPILLVLLVAFTLRTYRLTEIPPGLTHDEANHGREAIGVLDGILLFYFPLNYGSEPLYSYTVAGTMLALGETPFALRLVNVIFGLAAICITWLWTKTVFDRRVAWLVAALLAVSFWPLASSREALRAGMLPFFMGGAVWFFWVLFNRAQMLANSQLAPKPSTFTSSPLFWPAIGLGVCVAITLHIYLAARVAWLVFPLFLCYLLLLHRPTGRRLILPVTGALILAGLLVVPMFVYLQYHPEALTRLDMLDRPLEELRAGNFGPLLQNAGRAFLALIWPGFGDAFLAYNIPGRPTLDVITAVFFLVGLVTCFWYWRQPRYAFVLLWFGVGILPSLITGPTANTTRNLAALAPIHLLPAIGFVTLATQLQQHIRTNLKPILTTTAVLWLGITTWTTTQDYFIRWGDAPEVRNAYQHTLIEILTYLRQHPPTQPVVISTVYPGPAHDPSIGLVHTTTQPMDIRWTDGRFALILPYGRSATTFIPASTPLHPLFAQWLLPEETITLRPDDLDPAFTRYQFPANAVQKWLTTETAVNFGNAVQLLHAQWLKDTYLPGETAELLTIWRVTDPAAVGPIVPPVYTTDVNLFTHVLSNDGQVFLQRDSLEAPSWDWQRDDIIFQIHPIPLPADTPGGQYETAVGLYDKASGQRLPVLDQTGNVVETRAFVPPLNIKNP